MTSLSLLPVGAWAAVVALLVLAVTHSALGERALIGPLVRGPLPPLGIPRAMAAPILRFAWHLTSLAWVTLAVIVVVGPTQAVVAPVSAFLCLSAVIVAVASRGGHLAWPVFGAGGLASLDLIAPWRSAAAVQTVAVSVGAVLVALALLHAYWALGGRRGIAFALPTTRADVRVFTPGPLLTALVALALGAAAITVVHAGFAAAAELGGFARAAAGLLALVFALRVVGDSRTVGVLKRVRGTPFARLDDLVYTPLCFALSAACAVVWAGPR